ncbi:sensor histidine kinase [Demequina sp. NBRC 110057]|uniref:sensor histidine kinase n=1 Tax=Demequina sp. NBRC 110057 TaxID=1570346 RepID=UPI000A06E270|nr:histidine kinase [Demequina sp. NBRC 110057]
MTSSRRLPLPASERGRDAVGAALLAAAILVIAVVDGAPDAQGWVDVAVTFIACAALVWRRTWPVPVLLVTAAIFVVATLASGEISAALIPAVVALYTAVSRVAHVSVALAIGALAVVVAGGTLVADGSRGPTDSVVVSAEIWMALVTAVGIAVSLYRRSVAQERERTRQAEETRDAMARSRVAEERLRIARELHDAVGHHVAVMNVQAGVAEALLESDPRRAADALALVQDSGARVLEELPVMLRVLRQDEDDVRPTQGIGELDALVEEARAAGLAVEVSADAVPTDLPAAADHGAYRIVQEALTNARKHGDGTATVTVGAAAASLELEVRNRIGHAGDAAPSGFGLLGMSERASAAGGTVSAAREGDEFVVRASLPLREGGSR